MDGKKSLKIFLGVMVVFLLLNGVVTTRVAATLEPAAEGSYGVLAGDHGRGKSFADQSQSVLDQGGAVVPHLSSEYGRYYQLPDGSMAALLPSTPVQYQTTDGSYALTDHHIVPVSNRESYAYKNAAHAFSTYFPAAADHTSDILVQTPNNSGINLWNQSELWYESAAGERIRLYQAENSLADIDGNTIQYPDRYPGISEAFTVRYEGLKHTFEISHVPIFLDGLSEGNLEFQEVVVLPVGTALSVVGVIQAGSFITDQRIELIDSAGGSLGYFPSPWAFDSPDTDTAYSEQRLSYRVVAIGSGSFAVSVRVPVEWLKDPGRSFPVTIDPAVYFYENNGNDDCTQFSSAGVEYIKPNLRVGYHSTNGLPYFLAFMTMQDVNIPPGSLIIMAHLYFAAYADSTTAASFKWQFEDSDNAQQCPGENPEDRDYVSSYIKISPYTTAWTEDDWHIVGSFNGGLQQVIDRPGWSFGNNVGLAWSPYEAGGGYRDIYSYEGGMAPYLYVNFIPPPDDNYEENDDHTTAYYPGYDWEQTWLSSIDGYGIQGDEDWYQITVSEGFENVVIDCNFSHIDGDINLYLHNSSGIFLYVSLSSTDNEHIEYEVSDPGTYYIRVQNANAYNKYDLWWDDTINPKIWIKPPVGPGAEINLSTYAPQPTSPISEGSQPLAKVSRSTAEGLTLDFEIGDYDITSLHQGGRQFSHIFLPNSGSTVEIGKPGLPTFGRFIAIPDGANVEIEVLEASMKTIPDILVYPYQGPQTDSLDLDEAPPFVMDEESYSLDEVYPGEILAADAPVIMRGTQMSIVRFYPFQYNPALRELTVYEKVQVRINFNRGDLGFGVPRTGGSSFDKLLGNLLLNYEQLSPLPDIQYPESSTGAEFLIITHPLFEIAAAELAAWRNYQGIDTEVRTTDQTGTTAAEIGDYIQDAYDTWTPAPEFVLFIGDSEFIPTNYQTLHPNHLEGDSLIGTDLYYATVDGTDYYPDIFTGRIPVDTLIEAQDVVDDIIGYDQNPVDEAAFYENVTVAAYFQDHYYDTDPPADGYEDRRFVLTSEKMRNFLRGMGYTVEHIYNAEDTVTPTNYNNGIYGSGGALPDGLLRANGFAWDGDDADITAAVNEGRFLLTHRDHGWFGGWAEPAFDIADVAALTNDDRLPVVFSMNCQTGWFDGETDDARFTRGDDAVTFAEAWLRNPNGGAVGIIAPTRNSYSGYNDFMVEGFIDAIYPDFMTYDHSGFDRPEYRMGVVLLYGKIAMESYWGGGLSQIEFEMFHYLGDPTTKIHTEPPQAFRILNKNSVALLITDIVKHNASAWLDVIPPQPTPFIIPPYGSVTVMVSADTSGLSSGTYTDRILVYSSDTDRSPFPAGNPDDPNGGVDVQLDLLNSAPRLGWTGGANYELDGLHPEFGFTDDDFIYNIQYSDRDGDAPNYVKVSILKGGVDIYGSPFAMVCAAGDYATGVTCSYTKSGFSEGADYSYYFDAQDNQGHHATHTVEVDHPVVIFDDADILVVDDDDNNPDVRSYYTGVLDALGKPYHIWDTDNSDSEPDATYLSRYEKVVWFTGDAWIHQVGPGPDGEAALTEWLDTGNKCLFLSSQDLTRGTCTNGFWTSYLGVDSKDSDAGYSTVTGSGSVFTGLGPYTLSYPFNNYSDRVTPILAAEAAFAAGSGDGAVNYDSGVFKTIFFGFPFEAIANSADRQDVMLAFLRWCGYRIYGPMILR